MQINDQSYLDLEAEFCQYESARVVILPFPYEGGISAGGGTGAAPAAVIEASAVLEFYDEVLKFEPYRVGIATLAPPTSVIYRRSGCSTPSTTSRAGFWRMASSWWMMDFLAPIFQHKQVVGFDVVELPASPVDRNSPHAVAKLIYRMIGLRLHHQPA